MFKNFFEKVMSVGDGVVPQPDAYTCQSACVHMAIGKQESIASIRANLLNNGEAGDPYNMGRLLRKYLGDRYLFEDNACLGDVRDWLKAGEFLITHGWFTGSGHVIGLDGVAIDTSNMSYKISVKDPWGEFDFRSWRYLTGAQSYDGYYSSYGIYAACVKGQSRSDAQYVYSCGELDSRLRGGWVHRIRPEGASIPGIVS